MEGKRSLLVLIVSPGFGECLLLVDSPQEFEVSRRAPWTAIMSPSGSSWRGA
jgi:hypothetical protein